jgi:hypothetical protein
VQLVIIPPLYCLRFFPPAEYCARGSLYDLLQEAREKPALKRALDWPRRVVMALDAAKGMLYLHGHKPAIIHRDLKSPNLLVEKNWKVKVSWSAALRGHGHGWGWCGPGRAAGWVAGVLEACRGR